MLSERKKKILLENLTGYVLILPLLIGLVVFTFYPIIQSFIDSFFDYEALGSKTNFGIQNYVKAFSAGNDDFVQAVKVTAVYSIVTIPLGLILSFCIALLLNRSFVGIKLFRLIYYLPVIIPAVAGGLLWRDVFNVKYGLGNKVLNIFGFSSQFFNVAESSMPTFIVMGLFGLGGGMVLWLASLKSIPTTYYEAASIEGSSFLNSLLKITIPICTPYILYMLIVGIIGSLQVFNNAFMLTGVNGGRGKSMYFYVMMIYQTAFQKFDFGYAAALSWILFFVIATLTLLTFKFSDRWVNY